MYELNTREYSSKSSKKGTVICWNKSADRETALCYTISVIFCKKGGAIMAWLAVLAIGLGSLVLMCSGSDEED